MPKKVSEEIRSSIILHRENEGFTLYDLVAKFGLSDPRFLKSFEIVTTVKSKGLLRIEKWLNQ